MLGSVGQLAVLPRWQVTPAIVKKARYSYSMKHRKSHRYFFALIIFMGGCIASPTQAIPKDEATIAYTETPVVITPTASSSKIPIPSGLILLSQCRENNCGTAIWLDNYDGEYWQFPFTGSELRLSHNHKLATFENNGDIWLIDLITRRSKNLTNTSDYSEKSVTWSPDDKSIAFLRSNDKSLTDIFIMDIASGEYANITNTPSKFERCLGYPQCSFGWWSQLPSFIFTGSGEPKKHELGEVLRGHCHTFGGECNTFPVKISLGDKTYTILDRINGVEHLPSLSPNGKFLAYDGGVLYNLETGEQKIIKLTDYGLTVESSNELDLSELVAPIWSPNGELIAWLGHTNSQGDIGLYVFDLAHDSGQLFTSYSPYFATLTLPAWQRWSSSQITWSPDGQWITLSDSEWGESGEKAFLWVISNDGRNKIKFDTGDYEMAPPVWSPDSKRLIFLQLFYGNTGLPPALQIIDVVDWKVSEIDTPENTSIYPIGWFNP
jgi:hypothetical protein